MTVTRPSFPAPRPIAARSTSSPTSWPACPLKGWRRSLLVARSLTICIAHWSDGIPASTRRASKRAWPTTRNKRPNVASAERSRLRLPERSEPRPEPPRQDQRLTTSSAKTERKSTDGKKEDRSSGTPGGQAAHRSFNGLIADRDEKRPGRPPPAFYSGSSSSFKWCPGTMSTRALTPDLAERLAKLLGLLGSDHPGERAAAGLKAHELLKREGLRWCDVIRTASDDDDDLDDDDDDGDGGLARHGDGLRGAGFAAVGSRGSCSCERWRATGTAPSEKQIDWLESIYSTASEAADDERIRHHRGPLARVVFR